MSEPPASPKLFGDLLALARGAWVREMALRLNRLGYLDYRRSDAIALRWLRHGQVPLGDVAATLGVSRQAARKVVDGLVERGFARLERDRVDGRRLNVELSNDGTRYARAVLEVITQLNHDVESQVAAYDLEMVKDVLRTVASRYGTA
ncbi:MAG: MarR family transcriptional regulator [Acidimicrobiales bacterium]|jgi:DNA-binding MarR family transcriptional regulator